MGERDNMSVLSHLKSLSHLRFPLLFQTWPPLIFPSTHLPITSYHLKIFPFSHHPIFSNNFFLRFRIFPSSHPLISPLSQMPGQHRPPSLDSMLSSHYNLDRLDRRVTWHVYGNSRKRKIGSAKSWTKPSSTAHKSSLSAGSKPSLCFLMLNIAR